MLLPRNDYAQRPLALLFTTDEIMITLANGEVVINPLVWYLWLERATAAQRAHFDLRTYDVVWPELHQHLDISVMIRSIKARSFTAN